MAAGREHGRELERLRHHPDHGHRLIVDRQRATDDARIGGEAALPDSVAEKDGLGAVPLAFVVIEEAAELRLDAEERKEILRDGDSAEAYGFAVAGEFVVPGA